MPTRADSAGKHVDQELKIRAEVVTRERAGPRATKRLLVGEPDQLGLMRDQLADDDFAPPTAVHASVHALLVQALRYGAV